MLLPLHIVLKVRARFAVIYYCKSTFYTQHTVLGNDREIVITLLLCVYLFTVQFLAETFSSKTLWLRYDEVKQHGKWIITTKIEMRNDILNESNGEGRRRSEKRKSAPNRFRCCCCFVLMFSLALFQSNWIRVVFIKLRLVWFVPRAHSLIYNIFVVTCTHARSTFSRCLSASSSPNSIFTFPASLFRFYDFISISWFYYYYCDC